MISVMGIVNHLTSACSRRRRTAESTSHGRDVRAFAAEALVVMLRDEVRQEGTSICGTATRRGTCKSYRRCYSRPCSVSVS